MPAGSPLRSPRSHGAADERRDAKARECSLTLGMLFVLGGLVTLGSLAVGAWPDACRLAIVVIGLIAIVSGAGVLWSGQRISRLTA